MTSPPALNGLYTPFVSPVSGGQKPLLGGSQPKGLFLNLQTITDFRVGINEACFYTDFLLNITSHKQANER